MGKILTLAVAGLVALGAWKYAHREPPDITEAQARKIAEDALEDFCLDEKSVCPDFSLKGEETPHDKRFKWGYRYENRHENPGKGILVSVGRKGDKSVELTMLPALDPADAAAMAAASGAPPAASGGPPPGEAHP